MNFLRPKAGEAVSIWLLLGGKVESDRVVIANASKKPRGFSLKGSICTCGQQRPFDVSQIRFRFLEALSCYQLLTPLFSGPNPPGDIFSYLLLTALTLKGSNFQKTSTGTKSRGFWAKFISLDWPWLTCFVYKKILLFPLVIYGMVICNGHTLPGSKKKARIAIVESWCISSKPILGVE